MPVFFHPASLPTPLGELSFAVDDNAALVAVTFGPASGLAPLCGLTPAQAYTLVPEPARTAAFREQLATYFTDALHGLDLPVAPRVGTPFQRRVWQTLARIPLGETWSYARLASEAGSGARAVGAAAGANPLSLVLPCHRVLGADGSLTGYAGGVARKRWLLLHEGAILA
jgi:methylated-DNA-[protein]-cysteine S-methyltransferase